MSTEFLNEFDMFVDFSPETRSVINRMTGLTVDEENAIATFVDAEVLNGNWSLYDEFWCFGLATSANALTGFISKTATNNGAVKETRGFLFDGTNYINSNFNPSSDGSILNNSLVGGYCDIDDEAGNNELIGLWIGSRVTVIRFYALLAGIQIGINTTSSADISPSITNEGLFLLARDISSEEEFYQDGVLVDTNTKLSSSVPNGSFFIGKRNLNEVPVALFKGAISTIIISKSVGFDFPGHNTNVNTLLTSLGAI